MVLDGSKINFLIAFVAGLITFFASCLLPLVPTYLAYLANLSGKQEVVGKRLFQRHVLVNGIIFTIGFITVFILLGASASAIGGFLIKYSAIIKKVGGIFLILMGLGMLNILKTPLSFLEKRIDLGIRFDHWAKIKSFLVGMTFGFAWTPCIGPVLAVILFWASQATYVSLGIWMLFAFGLGMGFPFIVIAAFFETLSPKLSHTQRFGFIINKIAGLIILIAGILLFVDRLSYLALKIINFFGYSSLSV